MSATPTALARRQQPQRQHVAEPAVEMPPGDGALRLVTYNVWFDGRNQASCGP